MKAYSLEELTSIGREKFNLDESWHCFSAEILDGGKGDTLRYGLSPKDEDGEWLDDEVYSHVSMIEDNKPLVEKTSDTINDRHGEYFEFIPDMLIHKERGE